MSSTRDSDSVVFITDIGTKYHREGCRYLGGGTGGPFSRAIVRRLRDSPLTGIWDGERVYAQGAAFGKNNAKEVNASTKRKQLASIGRFRRCKLTHTRITVGRCNRLQVAAELATLAKVDSEHLTHPRTGHLGLLLMREAFTTSAPSKTRSGSAGDATGGGIAKWPGYWRWVPYSRFQSVSSPVPRFTTSPARQLA